MVQARIDHGAGVHEKTVEKSVVQKYHKHD